MDMPDIVRTYFEADRRNSPDAVVAAFAADAVVKDEGARHEGTAAIRQWWVTAKDAYHHVAEPIETTPAGDKVLVRAKVSGDFPNSPVTLDVFFTIKDGRIVELEIK